MAIVVEKLTKNYKVKGGADVCALKGISFNLPDMGMVFVLGKSGCGKSTLLNVLGGLDGFDGGDVVVDGKSIKDYKARDMDAYRNDYIGFVFQENNLLERDSVRRNVALALDLQSLTDKEGKVDAALESVELKGYEDRKCNSISGGQKQRVAIARALIKQPKLLLCDEPTGALDSETGAGIFALLKELSSERLVVVVSHDRESAEKYGDRVIELKDGEIMSDSAPLSLSESGAPTAEKAESGAPEQVSEQTAESAKKHGGLRFARAYTTGVNYILARPIRMALCLFMCLLTFTLVGMSDAVYGFNRDRALYYTMEDFGYTYYAFGVGHMSNENNYTSGGAMSLNDAKELSTLLDVERTDYIYNLGWYYGIIQGCAMWSLPDDNPNRNDGLSKILSYGTIRSYVEADEQFIEDYGFSLVAGRLPQNTSEIAIPLFVYNFFEAYGYITVDGKEKINSYDELLGKTLTVGSIHPHSYTLTGIVDTNFNYEKQAKELFGAQLFFGDEVSFYEGFSTDMGNIQGDAIHNTIFVCKGFVEYFNDFAGKLVPEEDETVKRVIAPYKGSRKQKMKNISVYKTIYRDFSISKYNHNGACYHIGNCGTAMICDAEDTFEIISEYAVYVVIALVAICALFLLYYSSGTITEKRKEIGIFRALGASKFDILKIFFGEHGTFTAIAVAVASVLGAIGTAVYNSTFTKNFGISITLVRFGIRQFAVVAAIAVLAVVLGIAIPLYKLLKAKPVDIIAERK